jgi:hypothetical protein
MLSEILRHLANSRWALGIGAAFAAGLATAIIGVSPGRLRKSISTIWGVLTRHRNAAVLGLAGSVLAIRLALLPLLPAPVPSVPDEFSYLLLGATFARGRVANPAHPLWHHFETLFVLSQPRYASVYPPLQGFFLALGEILAGQPWIGVCLSVCAMSAAILWMLQARMPARWAAFGAILAVLQFGIFGYWMNSYWGGAPAALAGALVLGSLARLRCGKSRYAALLALGLGMLANSRPYEGLVLAVAVVAVLVRRWFPLKMPGPNSTLVREALPCAVVCVTVAAAMAAYYWRITGHPLEMPYQAYVRQYAAAPAFIWQPVPPAGESGDETLRLAHRSFLLDYERVWSLSRFISDRASRLAKIAAFYFGPLWIVVVVLLPVLLKERRTRFLVALAVSAMIAMLLPVPFQLHYAAPFTAVFVALLTESLRRLWVLKRYGIWIGRYLVIAAPAVLLIPLLVAQTQAQPVPRLAQRTGVVQHLRSIPGRHLVIVKYGPHHARLSGPVISVRKRTPGSCSIILIDRSGY